jgi:RimJ/RimL family protein N-acetyltransferase
MVTKEDLLYRQVFTLKDGARVLIRPLIKDDRQALFDLFTPIPPEERRFMRHNVSDENTVSAWVENLNYDNIFPLVAVVGDRIVGDATVHFSSGSARHRAEIRIFLAKDFRHRGLGTKLVQAAIDIAKRRSLYLMEVQVVRDVTYLIKAMQKMGFEVVATLEDYFMLPDGELRDVVIMVNRLRLPEGEF